MKAGFYIVVPALMLLSSSGLAAEVQELNSENDRINYSVGYQLGSDLKRQGVAARPEIMLKGVEDAIAGQQPRMSAQEMRTTLMELSQQLAAAQREQMQQQARAHREAGQAFLAANSGKEGVETLPSGLQYRVLRQGSGNSPKPADSVTVHYRGTLIDGSEFDSSHRRGQPATFRVDRVIPGWTQALQLMKPGAKWQLFIPPTLAYGERSTGKIPPNSVLVFEVELLSVEATESAASGGAPEPD